MTSTHSIPSALDWETRSRTVRLGKASIPVVDLAIAGIMGLGAVVAVLFLLDYGWSFTYVINVLIHVGLVGVQLFRRLHPRFSLVATGLLFGAYLLLFISTPINLGISLALIAAPSSVSAAARWIPNRAWGIGALLVGLAGSLVNPVALRYSSVNGVWINTGSVVAVVVIGAAYAFATLRRSQAEQQVAEVQAAIVGERLHISRDLHDLVGHGLTVVKVHAQTAQAIGTPEAAEQALEAVVQASDQSLAQVRAMVAQLRDEQDRTANAPDPAEMYQLIEQTEADGLIVNTDLPAPESFREHVSDWSEKESLTFLRVITEILTNASRYSTGEAELSVCVHDGQCIISSANTVKEPTITAKDTNPSSTSRSSSKGFGLTGMRERLDAVGGSLEVHHREGVFTLLASIPVPSES